MFHLTPRLKRAGIRRMRRAGRAAAATRDGALALAVPGTTTLALDRFVASDTRRRGGRCAQYGYMGDAGPFPAHVCTSVNDVVCHGIPSAGVVLGSGDIVNVDVTTWLDGWHGDTSRTIVIGEGGPEARHVVRVAEEALAIGIAAAGPGVDLHAIGRAIEPFVVGEGCSVVADYGGHGIGRQMHQPPHVHHTARRERGPTLLPGHCLTIEPMVNLGRPEVVHASDGWTVRTVDGSLSAQFEHTILITTTGVEVLTRRV
jgi:methionyl aminopeptidase